MEVAFVLNDGAEGWCVNFLLLPQQITTNLVH